MTCVSATRSRSASATIQPNDPIPTTLRSGHPIRLNVWAAVGVNHWTAPVIYEGKMNGDLYDKMIKDHLLPMWPGEGFHYLHDNATFHKTPEVLDRLAVARIPLMWNYPPYSPDLNPIEWVWGWLKREVQWYQPQNKQELINAIKQSWRNMPQEVLAGFMRHMKTNIIKVIANNGGTS